MYAGNKNLEAWQRHWMTFAAARVAGAYVQAARLKASVHGQTMFPHPAPPAFAALSKQCDYNLLISRSAIILSRSWPWHHPKE